MLIKVYPYLFVFLALTTVGQWLSINWWAPNLTISFIEWCFCFLILVYPTFKYQHLKIMSKIGAYKLLNIFLFYTLYLSLYSIVKYHNIERSDLAALLSYCMAMLSCILIYSLSYPYWMFKALRILYKYLPFIVIIYAPFARNQAYGDLLGFLCMPALLLLLFFKELPKKQKYIWLIITITIIICSFIGDARSHVIKYAISLLLGITLYWDKFYYKIRHFIWSFFILPFFLLFLGISGIFNIFEVNTYIDSKSIDEGTIEDTRTLVFQEVFMSALNNNYILIGRGIGKGYESLFQQNRTSMTNLKTTELNSSERQSEVGILNIFTWGGIIYVVLFTLFCISVVYYGLYKSKNRLSRNCAIFFAFYFFYSWVENFQNFSMFFISTWLLIALCISPCFRNMTNMEFKEYINKLLK